LATILEKRDLSSLKIDEIKTKANILRAFVEKVEEGKEKLGRAESEL
jgi:protein disulfide-isomerase A6